jgi:hypothetical protein
MAETVTSTRESPIMITSEELRAYISQKFAAHVDIPADELFGHDLTLSAIIARSPRMTNSVDLMEAFARTANGLRKEHGLRVRLPTLPLDTPVSEVLSVFIAEAQASLTPPHAIAAE